MLTRPFKLAYRELISEPRNRVSFWVLAGFLPTFVLARLLVTLDPDLFLKIRGIHVHHFTYGIIVLALVGYLALTTGRPTHRWLSALYGTGLALSFDEFGMWVRLTDNYNLDQSENIMVAILVFLFIVVYFTDWLRRVFRFYRPVKSRSDSS